MIDTAYTINDVPGKDPLDRPPKVVYRGLRGLSKALFNWNDPLDPAVNPPRWPFPGVFP